jgi:hypothetical protein
MEPSSFTDMEKPTMAIIIFLSIGAENLWFTLTIFFRIVFAPLAWLNTERLRERPGLSKAL